MNLISIGNLILIMMLASSTLAIANPKNKERKSLLETSNKVIVGDNQYYLRAVLEYYLNNALISKYGKISADVNPDNPLENNGAAPKLHNILTISFQPEDFRGYKGAIPNNGELSLPYSTCKYKIPKKLSDLTSGLTYRYYRFNGTMKASMQAFGIASGDADSETEFIVIDYLQYKDCHCDGLPTIRYAVGLRTELKFTKLNSKVEFNSIGSMPQLAAQVQLGQTKVTFSMKSIGLTGPEVRFNIPSEMDFNVSSFREFQNAIEFLRGMEIPDRVDTNKLYVDPVMIPVLDDFRTEFETSLYDMVDEIRSLIKLRRRVKRKLGLNWKKDFCTNKDSAKNNPVKCNYQTQVGLIDQQIKTYSSERQFSQDFDKVIGSLHRYEPLFKLIEGSNSKAAEEIEKLWREGSWKTNREPGTVDPAKK